ncbi:MAG TPA: ferredoxin reductase [Nevskiaceae bacterium]|nr:ferredoxin reductase [Nevskiaceae bacterium]
MQTHNTTPSTNRPLFLRHLLASRFVQTLSYPHGVDHYLESVNALWSLKEVRACVVATRQQTPDTVTVTLRPNENWSGFAAGQYVRVAVDVDGVRHTRCFSPANSVHAADGCLELTCKIGPHSVVSRHFAAGSVGEVVRLSQAEGTFRLPKVRPERVLLISGGSGITPVLAMLRTLLDEGFGGRITFLHYAKGAADQLYAAELAQVAATHGNVQLLRCYADGASGELEGLFSAAQLTSAVPDWASTQAFLCGPPGMMKVVEAAFDRAQVADRLHVERFSAAPAESVVAADVAGEVRYARSERVAENHGGSLLEQAEAAGLRPECGCRMGICHSCTTRKLSGRVRDLRTGEVSGDGEEDIQICVCAPVGTVALDL